MSEVTDLVVIEKANAMTVFQSADQIEEILQKVEREVMSFVPDITTAKGRKEIASLAYKVAQTTAIEAERRKAQEEAERIRREAEAKEQARIAEEKRIKDEEERRAKDKAHRKEVNNKILADLIKVGASEDVAKNIITAFVKGEVFATKITY